MEVALDRRAGEPVDTLVFASLEGVLQHCQAEDCGHRASVEIVGADGGRQVACLDLGHVRAMVARRAGASAGACVEVVWHMQVGREVHAEEETGTLELVDGATCWLPPLVVVQGLLGGPLVGSLARKASDYWTVRSAAGVECSFDPAVAEVRFVTVAS